MCLSRLAEDSKEEWLREEMKPVAESLTLSGKNILLVTEKLHLQPEHQGRWEELVATVQQILVDTRKVRLRRLLGHCWRTYLGM